MTALYVVTLEIAPEAEAQWLQWMKEHHVAEVLKEPGFLSARLWKQTEGAPDGWARYAGQYELTSVEAVERYVASDAARRLRADGTTRFGAHMRATRAVFSEVASFGPRP